MKPKYPRAALKYTALLALTAVAVPLIAGAITSFGASRRAAIEVKDSLARDVLASASAQALAITVLVEGLTPGAQLADRCVKGQLPPAVVKLDDVCQAAAVREITDEQETYLELRRTQQDAQALVTRLQNQVEGDDAWRRWSSTATALRNLQRFESSTTCNAARANLVNELETDPDKASGWRAWLDTPVTYLTVEQGATVERQQLVRDALIGPPPASGARCDDHGPAFGEAMRVGRNGLVTEAGEVAQGIGTSRLKNVDDTYGDLLRSVLSNWVAIVALVAAGLLGLLSLRFSDKPLPKPVTPPLPPPTKGSNSQPT